jgi:hypothetical protein
MHLELLCPACGIREVDFEAFNSTIMLAPNLALMQFDCPVCQTPLEVTVKLSRSQQQQLQAFLRTRASTGTHPSAQAADDRAAPICYSAPLVVDACEDILQILLAPPTTTPDARLRIQEFHDQLERTGSVDEVLAQIDARHRPPRF